MIAGRPMRFSLKACFVCLALLSIWMAAQSARVRCQLRAIDHIERCGGYVTYDAESSESPGKSSPSSLLGRHGTEDVFDVTVRAATRTDHPYFTIRQLSCLSSIQWLLIDDYPYEDFRYLRRFKKLEYLSIDRSNFSDFRFLATLERIQVLSISGTPVVDLLGVEKLTDLRHLFVANTQVSDLEPLRNLRHLSCLDITGTHVSNLDALLDIPSLANLFVTDPDSTAVRHLKAQNPNIRINDWSSVDHQWGIQ